VKPVDGLEAKLQPLLQLKLNCCIELSLYSILMHVMPVQDVFDLCIVEQSDGMTDFSRGVAVQCMCIFSSSLPAMG